MEENKFNSDRKSTFDLGLQIHRYRRDEIQERYMLDPRRVKSFVIPCRIHKTEVYRKYYEEIVRITNLHE